jgi:dynein light intermediate chain 1
MGKGEVLSVSTIPDDNIWNQILADATRESANILEPRTVLILGDRNAGKSALLARLQGQEISALSKGHALSYTFIDVYDDEADDPVGRVDVWTFEGEPAHRDLLQFALNEKNISNALVVIALDFSQPWSLVESLRKWIGLLKEHTSILRDRLPQDLEEKVRLYWQTYQEPPEGGAPGSHNKKKKRQRIHLPHDMASLPSLDENTLSHNLGVPLVIVCCKTDSVVMLEKDYDYKDALFDYIQTHLRRICLNYGASLVYTSAKKDINCELLMEYIEHRLFAFEFHHHCQLLEKDSVFVPAGWDTISKISADFGNQNICKDPEEPYESVVKKPITIKRREQAQVTLITAEDDQEFLARHKATLDREAEERGETPIQRQGLISFRPFGAVMPSSPVEASNTPTQRSPLMPGSPIDVDDLDDMLLSPKRSAGSPQAASPAGTGSASASPDTNKDRQVLASFFTSLMTSKDRAFRGKLAQTKSASAIFASPQQQQQLRQDVEKELDRLKRAIKK